MEIANFDYEKVVRSRASALAQRYDCMIGFYENNPDRMLYNRNFVQSLRESLVKEKSLRNRPRERKNLILRLNKLVGKKC